MDNQNQQQISPIQPQTFVLSGVGDLLKRTRQIYQTRWKTILGLMAISILVSFFSRLLLVVLGITTFIIFSPQLFIGSILIALFIFIAGAVIWSWVSISLLYAVKERGTRIGIKESLRRGVPKILPFFWVSILFSLIVEGGALLFIRPFAK